MYINKKIILMALMLFSMKTYCMDDSFFSFKPERVSSFRDSMQEQDKDRKDELENISKIKNMIENKEDLNALSIMKIYQSITPLMFCVDKNNIELLKLLLENGANPNISNSTSFSLPSSLDLPLNSAIFSSKLEAVKILLQYKANPNIIVDDCGDPETSLVIAVEKCGSIEGIKILELLLKNGVDPDVLLSDNYHYQKTALSTCIYKLDESLSSEYFIKYSKFFLKGIKLLLLYGANPNLKFEKKIFLCEKDCYSAVDYAEHLNLDQVVKIFKEYPGMRAQTVLILLGKVKPELPNEIINMIIKLVVGEGIKYRNQNEKKNDILIVDLD